MIQPIFENLSDRDFAEAISEFIGPDYSVVSDSDSTGEFPSEPGRITAVLAAYLEPVPGHKVVNTAYVNMNPEMVPDNRVAWVYNKRVADLVKAARRLNPIKKMVQSSYIEIMQEADRRLLVAHVVGKLAASGEIFDGVVYPKQVQKVLPFQLRELVLIGMEDAKNRDVKLTEEQQRRFQMALTQSPEMQHTAAVAAATFLPTPKQFRDRFASQ